MSINKDLSFDVLISISNNINHVFDFCRGKKHKEIKKKHCWVVFRNFDLRQYNSAQDVHGKPQLHFKVAGMMSSVPLGILGNGP